MAPPAMAPRGPARHSPAMIPVSAPMATCTLGGCGRGFGSGGYWNKITDIIGRLIIELCDLEYIVKVHATVFIYNLQSPSCQTTIERIKWGRIALEVESLMSLSFEGQDNLQKDRYELKSNLDGSWELGGVLRILWPSWRFITLLTSHPISFLGLAMTYAMHELISWLYAMHQFIPWLNAVF